MPVTLETALIVLTPEVEDLIGPIRLKHDPWARGGVPAHITILSPFLLPEQAAAQREAIRDVVASCPTFSYRFARSGRFPEGVLWLAPEPRAPFDALMRAVWDRWPDLPPYGGAVSEVVPHCTIAEPHGDPDLDAIEVAVAAGLPVSLRADAVTYMVGENGTWHTVDRFPLGGAA